MEINIFIFRAAQLFSATHRKDSISRVELSTPQGHTQVCSLGVGTINGKYLQEETDRKLGFEKDVSRKSKLTESTT